MFLHGFHNAFYSILAVIIQTLAKNLHDSKETARGSDTCVQNNACELQVEHLLGCKQFFLAIHERAPSWNSSLLAVAVAVAVV
jgi:hypothetical protein